MKDYIFLYLIGSFFAAASVCLSNLFLYLTNQAIGESQVLRHSRQLLGEDIVPNQLKVFKKEFFLTSFLSYIGVLIYVFVIFTQIIRLLRIIFNPLPQKVREVRFPLTSNKPPGSSYELWARLVLIEFFEDGTLYSETNTELSFPRLSHTGVLLSRDEAMYWIKAIADSINLDLRLVPKYKELKNFTETQTK